MKLPNRHFVVHQDGSIKSQLELYKGSRIYQGNHLLKFIADAAVCIPGEQNLICLPQSPIAIFEKQWQLAALQPMPPFSSHCRRWLLEIEAVTQSSKNCICKALVFFAFLPVLETLDGEKLTLRTYLQPPPYPCHMASSLTPALPLGMAALARGVGTPWPRVAEK